MSYQEVNRGLQINDHADLAEARRRLPDHTIYRKVASVESLRSFMRAHVFAVWGFHVAGQATSTRTDVRVTTLDALKRSRRCAPDK
ncbi:DUF3050 domain-containing protein [Paraburkholderia sp. RL18-101-BIB-B]|uniref:DUF3050 domain-containing protein n=1 Tax=Paraburkholderia sp. RL18-101-BIB-B TaxID=3031634 RepID=UPI0038BD439F